MSGKIVSDNKVVTREEIAHMRQMVDRQLSDLFSYINWCIEEGYEFSELWTFYMAWFRFRIWIDKVEGSFITASSTRILMFIEEIGDKERYLKMALEKEVEKMKPNCKLIGTDGNVFAIIGKVSKVLKKAGQQDKAKEFSEKAFECGSYNEVLRLMGKYVEVS